MVYKLLIHFVTQVDKVLKNKVILNWTFFPIKDWEILLEIWLTSLTSWNLLPSFLKSWSDTNWLVRTASRIRRTVTNILWLRIRLFLSAKSTMYGKLFTLKCPLLITLCSMETSRLWLKITIIRFWSYHQYLKTLKVLLDNFWWSDQ